MDVRKFELLVFVFAKSVNIDICIRIRFQYGCQMMYPIRYIILFSIQFYRETSDTIRIREKICSMKPFKT
jgi:hypothetical protein